MHEVVADVVDELIGTSSGGGGGLAQASEAAAAADAWMLVSELGTQPYRDNATGVCDIFRMVRQSFCWLHCWSVPTVNFTVCDQHESACGSYQRGSTM